MLDFWDRPHVHTHVNAWDDIQMSCCRRWCSVVCDRCWLWSATVDDVSLNGTDTSYCPIPHVHTSSTAFSGIDTAMTVGFSIFSLLVNFPKAPWTGWWWGLWSLEEEYERLVSNGWGVWLCCVRCLNQTRYTTLSVNHLLEFQWWCILLNV